MIHSFVRQKIFYEVCYEIYTGDSFFSSEELFLETSKLKELCHCCITDFDIQYHKELKSFPKHLFWPEQIYDKSEKSQSPRSGIGDN